MPIVQHYLHRVNERQLIAELQAAMRTDSAQEQARLQRATQAYKGQQALLGLDTTGFDELATRILMDAAGTPELRLYGGRNGQLARAVTEYSNAQDALYDALEASLAKRGISTEHVMYDMPTDGYTNATALTQEMLITIQKQLDASIRFPAVQFER